MKKAILCFIIMVLHINLYAAPLFPFLYHRVQTTKMVRNSIPEPTADQQKIIARITFYHNHQDRFGDKLAIGGRAKQGVTIAAHPDFKFGKVIDIPNLKRVIGSGEFIVQDRGTDITSKRASHHTAYVFDIYIHANNKKEGDKLISKYSNQLGDYTSVFFKDRG